MILGETAEAGLILVKILVAGVKMVGEDWASIIWLAL